MEGVLVETAACWARDNKVDREHFGEVCSRVQAGTLLQGARVHMFGNHLQLPINRLRQIQSAFWSFYETQPIRRVVHGKLTSLLQWATQNLSCSTRREPRFVYLDLGKRWWSQESLCLLLSQLLALQGNKSWGHQKDLLATFDRYCSDYSEGIPAMKTIVVRAMNELSPFLLQTKQFLETVASFLLV